MFRQWAKPCKWDWFDVDHEIDDDVEDNQRYIVTMHRLGQYAWNILKE